MDDKRRGRQGNLKCCTEEVPHVCRDPDPTAPAARAWGDPHMTGFLGQKFDFTGEDDGGYYAVISDCPNLHMNMVSDSATGILGETSTPTEDAYGQD
ncbi:unnamed protein product, partial [Ectocarpus sp. 12 AP-2014]